ncbi:MAG: hypothetical protein ACHQRM_11070 [Bacteroidia bacterium]
MLPAVSLDSWLRILVSHPVANSWCLLIYKSAIYVIKSLVENKTHF